MTVGFDKITDRILAGAGKTGRAYYDAVDAAKKTAVAECEADAGHRCSVADMYYGGDFYLIKRPGAEGHPPGLCAAANYGDEIDNFMAAHHRRLHLLPRLQRARTASRPRLQGQRALRAASTWPCPRR